MTKVLGLEMFSILFHQHSEIGNPFYVGKEPVAIFVSSYEKCFYMQNLSVLLILFYFSCLHFCFAPAVISHLFPHFIVFQLNILCF